MVKSQPALISGNGHFMRYDVQGLLSANTSHLILRNIKLGIEIVLGAAFTKNSTMKAIDKEFNSTLKVLLVDDNHDLAYITGLLLGLSGFQVQICNNGNDCIRLSKSTKPDVILLDIDMPVLDGFQVCKYIRNQDWGRNLAIIAFTGQDFHSLRIQDTLTHFDNYLLKPAENEALSIAIVSTFQKKQLTIS